MASLSQYLQNHNNDYSALESRFRQATGGELVLDPIGSCANDLATMTRSATILIGSYNSRDTLRRTLFSIEQSSFNRKYGHLLEVVVVDDGSSDGTRETIADLELGVRLKYILQDRGGLTQAHNTGVSFAEGDILIFADSDIVFTEHAIEELMKRHEVLDNVTLIGFRFEMDPSDPIVTFSGEWEAQDRLLPLFHYDFRLNFPGRPENICRATRHWKDYGFSRTVSMTNGAHYNLPAMVVGAFFSITRRDYLNMGGSDERLSGWGCEDSLIGSRSMGLGNYIVPVYSAAVAHLSHPRRTPHEGDEFARNIATVNRILREEFAIHPAPDYRHRAREFFCKEPSKSAAQSRTPNRPLTPVEKRVGAMERGSMEYALGKFEEAIRHFSDAMAQIPDSPWPLVGKGKALRELRLYDDAVTAFCQALEHDRENGWAHVELALTYAATADYDRASSHFRSAIQAGVFDARWALETGSPAHKSRGNHHAGQGFHEVAIRDFDLALTVDRFNVWAHYDRGLSLQSLGRLEEALVSFQNADQLLHPQDGNRTWVHTNLGKTYASLGHISRAKVQFETALEHYPGNWQARQALAELHAGLESGERLLCAASLMRNIDSIDGWLTVAEAEMLIAAVLKAAEGARSGAPLHIVEVGSFCGRSTAVIGHVIRCLKLENLSFHAIDPHDGYFLGGGRDTYQLLRGNLQTQGLDDVVDVVRERSTSVHWDKPVALLFIDGLHDYEYVKADFLHFQDWLVADGLVAFHDYVNYCPGVMQFVNSLMQQETLQFIGQRDSLILLKKKSGAG